VRGQEGPDHREPGDRRQAAPAAAEIPEHAALQCGFCTPGFLVAAKALLDTNANPSETEIRSGWPATCAAARVYDKIVRAVQDPSARSARSLGRLHAGRRTALSPETVMREIRRAGVSHVVWLHRQRDQLALSAHEPSPA